MSNVLGCIRLFHTRNVHLFPSVILTLVATHNKKHKDNLKFHSNPIASCTGSHNTVCSKLAQLTLRKEHNYADSLVHSQAGPQTHWYLGRRDREVGVGDVKSNVETKFGVS